MIDDPSGAERDMQSIRTFHYSVLSVFGVIAAILLIAGFCSGCASWQTTVRQSMIGIHNGNNAAWSIGRQAYKDKCTKEALECYRASAQECPGLDKCQKSRRAFAQTLNSLDAAIVGGLTAIEFGDEDIAKKWLSVAIKLLAEAQQHLKLLGVMDKLDGLFGGQG